MQQGPYREPAVFIEEINSWLSASRLRLNPAKTEVVWLGSGQQINQVDVSDILILSSSVKVVESAQAWRHYRQSAVAVVTRCCALPVRILPLAAATSTLSVTTSRSHKGTSTGVYFMSPGVLQLPAVRSDDKLMRQVQSVQNAAARLITGAKRCKHITPILRQLHWLPVRRRVEFKMASLVYQVLSSKVPGYLADDIHLASESPACSLRSSSERKCSLCFTVVLVTDVLLQLDHVYGTTYLPVCETRKLHRIQKQLKTFMFQTDCGASWLFWYCAL